jgi:hypothetical protein
VCPSYPWDLSRLPQVHHHDTLGPSHVDVRRPMLARWQVDHDPELTAAQDDRQGA